MICASFAVASAIRSHLDFINFETGMAQPSDECRLKTRRPNRQCTAPLQRSVGGSQPRQAVEPIVTLSDYHRRAVINIKHDGIVGTAGSLYQLDNAGYMKFNPCVVKLAAGEIGKHSPVPLNHGWYQLGDYHLGILAKDVQRRSH